MLKERVGRGGERDEWSERNFRAQQRRLSRAAGRQRVATPLAGHLGDGGGHLLLGGGRRPAGESEHDSADRAEYRADEEREEHARPSEKRTHHPEEPYVAHPDAFAVAQQQIEFARDKEETR